MKPVRVLTVLILAGLAARAETLQAVFARIDREAAGFQSMTTRLTKTEFTAVLNDTSSENGQMWLRRKGRDLAMRTEIQKPEPRSIGFSGAQARIYYPKINTVQIYDLGKQRSLIDQFLVLGFGSSSKDLLKSYSVTIGGEDTVGGQKTTRLELVPKSKQVLDQVRKIELWFPLNAGHPIQQRFQQSGDDYYLVAYSALQLNPNLPESAFQLQLPANANKEYPQK